MQRAVYQDKMKRFGLPNEGDLYSRLPVFMHDTLIWKATSGSVHTNTLDQRELFDASYKNSILKTNVFPLPATRIVKLTHVAVTHNMDFTLDNHLAVFEEYSKLSINIESTDQFDLPLEFMLNYIRTPQGGRQVHAGLFDIVNSGATDPLTPGDYTIFYNTAENQLKYYDGTAWIIVSSNEILRDKLVPMPKYTGYIELPAPIELPQAGFQKLQFHPGGVNLTTSSITANGFKFGPGVIDESDSPVMFIKFKFAGRLVRPVK